MPNTAEVIENFIVGSPLARHLGVQVDRVEKDQVTMRLPFQNALTTIADLVHGGAIAALIDTAATAAAWSGADLDRGPRGATIALTVSYLSAGRGDLTATARVIQRGSTITVCDVAVAQADGKPIARGLVTYKLGRG